MLVTLDEVKRHLIIEHDLDDDLLKIYIDAAEEAVSIHLNVELHIIAGENSNSIKIAVLQMVGNMYANREPTSPANMQRIPYTYDYLIGLNRNYKNTSGI